IADGMGRILHELGLGHRECPRVAGQERVTNDRVEPPRDLGLGARVLEARDGQRAELEKRSRAEIDICLGHGRPFAPPMGRAYLDEPAAEASAAARGTESWEAGGCPACTRRGWGPTAC